LKRCSLSGIYQFVAFSMAATTQIASPRWSTRLTSELESHDQTARNLVTGLTVEQLNWHPAPGAWSVGQCLLHLCATNDAYLSPISEALQNKRRSPVDEIVPGWFGGWFLRSFIEPSPNSKPVPAPPKIRPAPRADLSIIDRFLSGNQTCRDVIVRASEVDVNRIRFWNPLIPGLRFTIGTGLQIIVSHERRHLLQAQRVKDADSFPQ
jgi:hypothetical protein